MFDALSLRHEDTGHLWNGIDESIRIPGLDTPLCGCSTNMPGMSVRFPTGRAAPC
ncbi:hypothetical protein MT355_03595 [Rathayibacter sp. VKM Ac-2929]|uniref:hypothetical protein n=1 Tax=Rathayibacter sp. VKM Ac-2929 TaxID=2929480 RepID=UPI001FB257ED|nr:hypothetical protein [Rathayibacter sp. VKM Ac-2929]MCJ1672331.1 hypothetical protein [Rathayibacter sp. VKM Ac-2929]MCJ1685085.1 hypothetical protein [Rathayibacter sp. VKM Ac-2928]